MGVLWRGTAVQRIRLLSGLVLFAFAAAHFVNHAVGLVSLDAMVAVDGWRTAVTGSPPGLLVLATALAAHVIGAFHKLGRKRTLAMPAWEAVQIALGLAIPFLLLPHVVNTRVAYSAFGVETSYPYEIVRIWASSMWLQTTLLLVVWLHGCLGLHYWLRLAPGYGTVAPALAVLAIIIPIAAIAGIVVQGQASVEDLKLAARFGARDLAARWPTGGTPDAIPALRWTAEWILAAIALVLALLWLGRLALERRARKIPVQYVGGPRVLTSEGPTLLEISRANGIPHLSVCGGRGRCSTCRILVTASVSSLSPAGLGELDTLRAIKAAPNVRLACQARPHDALSIMQILTVRAGAAGSPLASSGQEVAGIEQDIAILFIDIRGFTSMTEQKLAYDVVFILNQFFDAVGKPIYDLGGWIGNYAGDGIMALFTHPDGIDAACRAALLASAAVDRAVQVLNASVAHELPAPLRVAMGLHAGPLVLGRLGYADTMTMSVVGPAVNLASRLESLAKAADVELVVSFSTALRAGLNPSGFRSESVKIRGSEMPMTVLYVEDAGALVERLDDEEGRAVRAA